MLLSFGKFIQQSWELSIIYLVVVYVIGCVSQFDATFIFGESREPDLNYWFSVVTTIFDPKH